MMRRWFTVVLLLGALHTASALAAAPDAPKPPKVPARAWVLVDFHSGQVLAAHNADKPLPPASLTKLMTLYLAFSDLRDGRLKAAEAVSVPPEALRLPGARMFLEPGSPTRVDDLLKGVVVQSGNDATLTLVRRLAADDAAFVARMNAQAERLGLPSTRFMNATGLHHDQHVSTATDLSTLAIRLMKDFPDQRARFAQKQFTYNQITQHNRNALLWRDTSVDGLKTGHTRSAGYCVIATANRNGMRLIAVVLGADSERDRTEAAKQLLDHGFRHYETRLLYHASAPALTVRVYQGDADELPLAPERDLYLTLPRGRHGALEARADVPQVPVAPIRRGQTLGTLTVRDGSETVATLPLVAIRDIETGNWLRRSIDQVRLWVR